MTTSTDLYRIRQRPVMSGRSTSDAAVERFRPFTDRAEAVVAEPFIGITTDGTALPGLFPLRRTGVSTQPIKDAADAFLASLPEEQQTQARFPVDSPAWMQWLNVHPYVMRHGVLLENLNAVQREAALAILA